MDTKDYTKMYLVPPDVLKKLQEEQNLNNELDQSMYNIAKLNKISITQKWFLYRQQLARYMNRKRNSAAAVAVSGENTKALAFDRGVQTTREVRKKSDKPSTVTMSAQTDNNNNNNNEVIYESITDVQPQVPLMDEDEIALLASPANRLENPYDLGKTVTDELSRQEELENVKKRKKVSKKIQLSESDTDSDVIIVDKKTSPKRVRKPAVRRPTIKTRKAPSRSASKDTLDPQTGKGNKKQKTVSSTTMKWVYMP